MDAMSKCMAPTAGGSFGREMVRDVLGLVPGGLSKW